MTYDDDDDETTVCQVNNDSLKPTSISITALGDKQSQSVALTQTNGIKQRSSLFEEYLTFLTDEKDERGDIKMLNPVLLGYWCNLFRSLVQTHPQEVFIYVYEH